MSTFREDLSGILNFHSMENGSNTPDGILARYLERCMSAFDEAVNDREKWHGRAVPDTQAKEPR